MLIVAHLANCAPVTSFNHDAVLEVESTRQAIVDKAEELYRTREELALGNPSAEIAIVEFFDYNCGYCRKDVTEVSKLLETDGNIKIIIKELPILGPNSTLAAKAALASAKQGKYPDFH